ncbi:hypothetical protein GH714_000639 [Hevea brasiliensis]|uniref:J domain-containing protein n=2 Tax=Hevea brasiliensis TaxID=3981 RepID=A0A6A6LMM2_HEVBR|nr:hypothetical protein GH714_000639 [Hevea brasiliensis]
MQLLHEQFKAFVTSSWMVFVCAVMCRDWIPIWALLMIAVLQNFVGYGLVWLLDIVIKKIAFFAALGGLGYGAHWAIVPAVVLELFGLKSSKYLTRECSGTIQVNGVPDRRRAIDETVKMECNKEDAFRAKEVAEKKFIERDINGAKRFAMKAQKLCPGLDGLSQFLATLDVYISAEGRKYGEIDWYGVLGVDPLADEDTIRKHYRKLALTLHPDKNKSVGAEGAFKIVSEAWSFLSDKAKRSTYDQKRNSCDVYEKVPNFKFPMPAGQSGFHNFFCNSKSNTIQKSAPPKPAPPPRVPKSETFWTICNFCKVQYEYQRSLAQHTVFCFNCKRSFLAIEILPHL